MKFHSLRFRLIVVYLGLVLLGFGSLTLWAGQQIADSTYTDYGRSLHITALLMANQLAEPLEYDASRAANLVQATADELNAQIAIFDLQDELILTSDQRPAQLVSEETYVIMDGRVYARAEIREDHPIGTLQLSTPLDIPQAIVQQRLTALMVAFVLFSAVALLITLWLLNTMTQPLANLRNHALAIGNGDLSQRLTALPNNEIGAVGTAFNNMSDRVQALINEQRAFASNASHELRTPLTTIQLRTEAIQEGVEPELARQYVAEIDGEVKRLSQLVDDLMLLSRLDAQRLEMGQEQIDCGRLLHALHHQFLPVAQTQGIILKVEAPTTPLVVVASLSHLQIVFRNLIDNALKYTPAGGSVWVHLCQEEGQMRLTVADTGRGIAAEHLPHIGKRFYRTDQSRNRQTLGSGLGLSLVTSVLELYGGALEIQSAGINQGSQLVVLWPLGFDRAG